MKELINAMLSSHHVKRWNGTNVIGHRRSLSEHHFEVALITKEIVKIVKQFFIQNDMDFWYNQHLSNLETECLNYALIHDLPEIVTSDVSYICKRDNPELKSILTKIEDQFYSSLNENLSSFSEEAKLIVKTADIISVAIEIKEQLELGNINKFDMKNVEDIIQSTLMKYHSLRDMKIHGEIVDICDRILLKDKPWN